MKKKIFSVALVAVMGLIAGWNVMQSENEVALSDLALSNVEALVRSEADPDWNGFRLAYPSSHPGGCCERHSSTSKCSGSYSACGVN